MTKKHRPIHNLGAYAHEPKSNVNRAGPLKDQTAKTPTLIGKKVPPASVSNPSMRKS